MASKADLREFALRHALSELILAVSTGNQIAIPTLIQNGIKALKLSSVGAHSTQIEYDALMLRMLDLGEILIENGRAYWTHNGERVDHFPRG